MKLDGPFTQLGMVGLGRMGANLQRRLERAGHSCVGYDVNPAAVEAVRSGGGGVASSLADLVGALDPPRAVWVMLPAAFVDATVDQLAALLEPGDVIIDGGNSYYRDDLARAERLGPAGIHYVDIGVSGGVHGLERGFCLMIGGEGPIVDRLSPYFAALAPGVDAAPRTRPDVPSATTAEHGYLHCGPTGAGHFVKMVHNGVEYGLMAAYAEGLNVLRHANAGAEERPADAETAPVHDAEVYRYDLDLGAIAEVWRRGSVVSSWLLDVVAGALASDPGLEHYAGVVADSGEGRWTVHAAVDEGVPVPVLSAALYDRFTSRGEGDFAHKLLSAMRWQFGGHVEVTDAKPS